MPAGGGWARLGLLGLVYVWITEGIFGDLFIAFLGWTSKEGFLFSEKIE